MLEALVLSSIIACMQQKEKQLPHNRKLVGAAAGSPVQREKSALVTFMVIFMASSLLSVVALNDARMQRSVSATPSADVIIAYSSPVWYMLLRASGQLGEQLPTGV